MNRVLKGFIRICLFIAVIAGFVILTWFVTRNRKVEEKEEILPAVVIQKPVIQNLTESITISGYVEAKSMIPVVPFVSGTIVEYNAKAGNYVKKNTVLAKIDDEPFRQQMLQAQAAYFAAKSTYERIEMLHKSGAATQQNYDTVKAQYEASKAQYDLAALQMSYTEVKASIDGTILIADSAVGNIGTQTQPVAVIADLNRQVVRLQVPEKYFDLFTMERKNLQVTVTRPSQKGMYEDAVTTATIENIAPYISPESKNFIVVCRLNKPGERFRPGMYVKVNVAYKTFRNVPVLPVQTKKMDGSCYIYDAETQTVHWFVPEDIGTDSKYFVLDDDYRDTWFVTDGQNYVFDGQKVNVINE